MEKSKIEIYKQAGITPEIAVRAFLVTCFLIAGSIVGIICITVYINPEIVKWLLVGLSCISTFGFGYMLWLAQDNRRSEQ
jgi:hypothetical protein